jgi:hypothetical protein
MAILIPIYVKNNSENIYIDPEPQKSMCPLSTLSNLSTWCQVISKIQKSQKLVETTLQCWKHKSTASVTQILAGFL